jgi:glycerol-3-phosphate acyltransferase PlsY
VNELQDLVDQIPAPVVTGWIWISSFAVGYSIGAINPASIIARVRGTDLRAVGSGNPGATNAGRAFGWKVGVLVAALDILKGLVPVLVLTYLFGEVAGLIGGVAAVLGHITSPFLRGKGGKGVATSLGAVLGVHPVWALVVVVVFGIVFALTRRVGISSVVGSLALVPCALVWGDGPPDVLFAAVLTVIIVVRHRTNIAAAFGRTG